MSSTAPDAPTDGPTGRFAIVAIGASAGGVPALTRLVRALPRGFPTAVLIVQHLDPKRKSHLADLLRRDTDLIVKEAEDGDPIRPGCIYTAPPDTHLLVAAGRVVLRRSGLVHFARPSVDRLFETVADAYGKRALAVVLTGSGLDGAAGVEAIKRNGGITIVQDPREAAHRQMPQAAVLTGRVDHVLPLAEIGPTIVDLVLTPPIGA